MVHYKVEQDRKAGVWHVYDDWQGKRIRTYETRNVARWTVRAFNNGYYPLEKENDDEIQDNK